MSSIASEYDLSSIFSILSPFCYLVSNRKYIYIYPSNTCSLLIFFWNRFQFPECKEQMPLLTCGLSSAGGEKEEGCTGIFVKHFLSSFHKEFFPTLRGAIHEFSVIFPMCLPYVVYLLTVNKQ